jgi:hypothetical protein
MSYDRVQKAVTYQSEEAYTLEDFCKDAKRLFLNECSGSSGPNFGRMAVKL